MNAKYRIIFIVCQICVFINEKWIFPFSQSEGSELLHVTQIFKNLQI